MTGNTHDGKFERSMSNRLYVRRLLAMQPYPVRSTLASLIFSDKTLLSHPKRLANITEEVLRHWRMAH